MKLKSLLLIVVLSFLLICLPLAANAVDKPSQIVQDQELLFETSKQRLSSIEDRSIDIIPEFKWNQGGSAGDVWEDPILGSDWGAKLIGGTSGALGLGLGLNNLGGKVSVSYPGKVILYVNPPEGNNIVIDSKWFPRAAEAIIETESDAASVSLNGLFSINGNLSGALYTGGKIFDGKIFDKTIPKQDGTIVTLSADDTNLSTNHKKYGLSGELKMPKILSIDNIATEGHAVVATGSEQFGKLTIDLAQWASYSGGIPLKGEIDVEGHGVDYTLISMGPNFQLNEEHSFRFNPTSVSITLKLSSEVYYKINDNAEAYGSTITMLAGDSVKISMSSEGVDLTPSFTLNNTWTYHSGVTIGVNGSLKALSAGVTIAGTDIGLGPLLNKDFVSLVNKDIPQVTKTGSLNGFNTETGNIFEIYPTVTTATIQGTKGENDWFTTNSTMTLTTRAMFDVASQHYKVAKQMKQPEATTVSDWLNYTSPVTFDDGIYHVDFYAIDGAGVEEYPRKSVSFKVDTLPPVIEVNGDRTYTPDEDIDIRCSATDNLSGVFSDNCIELMNEMNKPAWEYTLGSHAIVLEATDYAGNKSTLETAFNVIVTPDSLCNLTSRFCTKSGVSKALCKIIMAYKTADQRGDTKAAVNQVHAYINAVLAQSGDGKSLTTKQADTLIYFANGLLVK